MNQIVKLNTNPKFIDANFTALAKRVSLESIDFSSATPVKSFGYRFIIPIPDLGSDNIHYEIPIDSGQSKIVQGYAFENLIDSAMQVVKANGEGAIKVAISPLAGDLIEISRKILDRIDELGGAENLNTVRLNQLIDYIHNALGQGDTYNSSDASVKRQMNPVDLASRNFHRPLGLYKNIEEFGALAVYIKEPSIVLDGPHAGFASYPNGFVAVRIPVAGETGKFSYKSIAPVAISYCYTLPNGDYIRDPLKQLKNIATNIS